MKIEQPECHLCASKNNSLFHYCHLHQLKHLEDAKTCSFYKRGQLIFSEGANPIGVYCVHTGKVKISKLAPDGKEQILRFAKQGDFLGYCSLLTSQPYGISATAIEDAKVCMVPRQAFAQLLQENKQFSDNLMKLMCSLITDSDGRITNIAYKSVRGRVAEALLFLNTFYKDSKNPEGCITITRDDLAAFAGTVKETAIRTLTDFKDEKLVETSRTGIKIINPLGLLKASEVYD